MAQVGSPRVQKAFTAFTGAFLSFHRKMLNFFLNLDVDMEETIFFTGAALLGEKDRFKEIAGPGNVYRNSILPIYVRNLMLR